MQIGPRKIGTNLYENNGPTPFRGPGLLRFRHGGTARTWGGLCAWTGLPYRFLKHAHAIASAAVNMVNSEHLSVESVSYKIEVQ